MSQAAKRIEMAANVAVIMVAVALLFGVIRNRTAAPPQVAVGTKFALTGISWQGAQKNLVLALSTSCHFCNESAPFYRELVQQCRQQHVRTIAVLPQPIADAESYLGGEGVATDEVRQSVLRELRIVRTPTLLLVDGAGVGKGCLGGKTVR